MMKCEAVYREGGRDSCPGGMGFDCRAESAGLVAPLEAITALASLAGESGLEQLHQFAESLGHAVDARDSDTFNHSVEVADVARLLAEALGLSPSQAGTVHLAGHLHDIGKIGVPDSILRKPGGLSAEEWGRMKRHPEIGAGILRPIEAFAEKGGIADMVLYHHERFDGTGYPHGLKGCRIPLGARIIAVADALSALLQNRPYRKGSGFAAALAEIGRCSGSQFDPAVVEALGRIAPRLPHLLRAASETEGGTEGQVWTRTKPVNVQT